MTPPVQHAFDPEEVMAYLDGELEPGRAAALAAHLENCAECNVQASYVRQVSERLLDFEIESAPARMDGIVSSALDEHRAAKETRERWNWRRLVASPRAWAFVCVLVVIVMLAIGIPFQRPEHVSNDIDWISPYKAELNREQLSEPRTGLTLEASPGARSGAPEKLEAPETAGPMIVQTASLNILAANYDYASKDLEPLAAEHGGYVEKLLAEAHNGDPREVSATLRVPANQLDGFLADLRKLGHVEEESRANDEVTDQYVDLDARLKNARATEQRMLDLLATRTGKLDDVLDAERELERVRGEIESMDGQRTLLLHRVAYASVQIQLREEYHASLGAGASSTGTSLRNAVIEGFQNLRDGLVSALLLFLAYGPATIFWLAVVLVPSWLVWRRLGRDRKVLSK
ncbi:MAG TPA: DUF4349 domain-containing protein [Candidatus Aquilonibacter sp.]|nr:DUF4349 domain-containing protein [Candidatus Aquilonibacter sp.]